MERRSILFYIAAALAVLIIIILSVLVVLKVTYDNCEDIERICLSSECIQPAAQILNYLDTTVNPCINFYAFACGNFITRTELPDNKNYVSTSTLMYDELQRQLREMLEEPIAAEEANYVKVLKTYYQACNNVVAIEQLGLDIAKQLLEGVGGWPVLHGPDWKGYEYDWYDYIYKLKDIGLDPDYFVTLSITDDKENRTLRIITINPPRLNLPSNDHAMTMNDFRRIYYPYMISVAKKMGATESRAVDELNHSLEFEINLNHSLTTDESPIVLTLSELNDKFPNIPWFEYIRTLMFPYATITKSERIVVAAPGYIRNLESLLTKTSKRVQVNYIMWRAIQTLIPYLSEELRERAFAYESVMYDILEKPPRWQQCVHETYDRLSLLLSSLYIQTYFDISTKESATSLVSFIKKQFVSMVQTSTKVSNRAKEDITDKILGLTDFVAYPDKVLQVQLIEKMYDKALVKVNSEEYLQSFLNINIHNREIFIKTLRQPVSEDSSFDNRIVGDLYAVYSSKKNSLSISAGSLQGLLYNKNYPDYLNYGGIGFFVAREITRAVDWGNSDLNSSDSLQCLVNQYSGYTISAIDEEVNGSLSLAQTISDNMGLKIAYHAYHRLIEANDVQQNLVALKYTPKQLFWITFAINQCSKEKVDFMRLLIDEYESLPAEFRVIGAIANSREFSNDFNCSIDKAMNPLDKCELI